MSETKPSVKFLLVDDLAENLIALEALLKRDDLELLKARSGPEALELLLKHDIALAFLDVHMPVMDGFELAELMRGTERSRHIPIIFVTAAPTDATRTFRGYEAGAVDFLYKPLDPHLIRSKAATFFALAQQKAQLQKVVRELEETVRLNEMFAAVLGHDLRNPLNVVATGVQLLEEMVSDPDARKALDRMRSGASRMSRMIDELLDFGRARRFGNIPILPREMDLSELAARVIAELQLAHPDRAFEKKFVGIVVGSWDDARLGQVLLNLLGNAIKHGSHDRPLIIEVDGSDPDWVRLAVANGGAMPQVARDELFEPFKNRTARKAGDGLGLGLYIVKQIAKGHGGDVEVVSTPELGTRFTVTLPRKAPPSPPIPSATSARLAARAARSEPAPSLLPRPVRESAPNGNKPKA